MKKIPTRSLQIALFVFLSLIGFLPETLSQAGCKDSMEIYSLRPQRKDLQAGNFLTALSNGNLVYRAGNSDTTSLILTDAQGKLLKAGRIFLPLIGGLGSAYKIAAMPDGGVMVTGLSTNLGFYGMFLARLNAALELVWVKKLRGVAERNFTDALTRDFDLYCDNDGVSYMIFHSYHYSSRLEDGAIVAIDPSGSLRWSRSFIFSGMNSFPDMINSMIIDGDRICFFGSGLKDSKPTAAAFMFDKHTGNFLSARRITIEDDPVDEVGSDFPLTHSARLAVSKNGFYYLIEAKNNFPRRSHLFRLELDQSLNPVSVLRIGNFSINQGTTKQATVNASGLVAFSGGGMNISGSNNCIGVIDAAGNMVLKKKLKPGLLQNGETITKLILTSSQRLQVGISGALADTLVQVNMPLYSDSLQYGCLDKDTLFFEVSSRTATASVITPYTTFVPGLLTTTDLDAAMIDLPVVKYEYCKVVSDCNTVQLAGNTLFCPGTDQTYKARKNAGCFKKLIWNTDTIPATVVSHTDTSITLRFNHAWTGKLIAGFEHCGVSESLELEAYPLAEAIYIGPDSTICPGATISLAAGNGFNSYLWNTGETTSGITINKAGVYSVSVMDHCGNKHADTVVVNVPAKPFVPIRDKMICSGDTLVIAEASGFYDYHWTPAVLQSGTIHWLAPQITTTYTLMAKGDHNCTWQDKFTIAVEKCPDEIWFPSAFTPNNDGKNDSFGPLTKARFIQYSFNVYNRWGQKVFSSTIPGEQWDGKLKGLDAPAGVYVWTCSYGYRNGVVKQAKGTLMLFR